MPSIPSSIFMDGLKSLLKIDEQWIPEGNGKSLYIRPFMIASSEFIRATPADEFTFFIITSPSASYYSGEVHLKVEEKFARSVEGGTGFAKAAIKAAKEGLPVFSDSADLQGSTGIAAFQKEFPGRFIDVGVAEANAVSTAVGLSKQGLIGIVDTFAQFAISKGNLPLIMSGLSQAPIIGLFLFIGNKTWIQPEPKSEALSWAKFNGYPIPYKPSNWWWIFALIMLFNGVLPGIIIFIWRGIKGKQYEQDLKSWEEKWIDNQKKN